MRAIEPPAESDSLRSRTVHFVVKFLQQLSALLGTQLALQLLEGEGHNVIVMRSRELGVGGNVKPQLVHKLDVLRAHARCVWAERILANGPIRRADLQSESRTRFLQAFPSIAGELRLFVSGKLVGQS